MERIKGVMHTDAGWLELNAADGELAMRPARPLLESRIEFIGRRRLAWWQIEQALLAGLWKA
ncbi:GTP-binding protein [endosymbiont of Riftia pachyptila]|uniref:GTP-binding protein n=1 Tax=endosymbiont of Riftia pachyptila TaxID=54396 RepID=UPI001F11F71F|nr:GTP-binding protein [endosymbiont of Riftia pachyptila]